MRKCPKSIARTEVDLTMTFLCSRTTSYQYDLQLVRQESRDVVLLKTVVPPESDVTVNFGLFIVFIYYSRTYWFYLGTLVLSHSRVSQLPNYSRLLLAN